MKVAVSHDYFGVFAGAERVTKEILALFPEADVFTLLNRMTDSSGFLDNHDVRTSPIDRLPYVERYYRALFPLFPWAFERFDLSDYDLVISSAHGAAKGVRGAADQLHICYCHSPPRWVWDLQQQYLEEAGMDSGMRGAIVRRLFDRFRSWDREASERVTHFIANSRYIGERIQRVYGRSSTVIYPPVDTEQFRIEYAKDDFYLVVSRLVWYKKVRLAVEAFNAMPDRRLVVVGGGPQLQEIRAMAGPNVEVRGHVEHSALVDHMQRARALIFPAEEDFGIVPVEAQACGTPVIAFGRGGARETILDGTTGLFFDEQSASSIRDAIRRFEGLEMHPHDIRRNAERFGEERFRAEMMAFVDRVVEGDK